jgi:hypothetical protein
MGKENTNIITCRTGNRWYKFSVTIILYELEICKYEGNINAKNGYKV